MIHKSTLTVVVMLVACSTASNAPTPIAPSRHSEAASNAAPQTPMRVRWNVLSDHNGHLAIEAIVERRASLSFPVSVRVEIPPGLSLVSGLLQFEVPADGQTGESATRLEFTYSGAAPTGDLMIIADAHAPGVGIHATDVYRFGRIEPAQVRPQPSGPNIKVGDKDLGPAIQIDRH